LVTAKLGLLTSGERNSSCSPFRSKILIRARELDRQRRPIGASDSACYAFGSGRNVEKLGAAAGEGAPGPTKKPVVKKK